MKLKLKFKIAQNIKKQHQVNVGKLNEMIGSSLQCLLLHTDSKKCEGQWMGKTKSHNQQQKKTNAHTHKKKYAKVFRFWFYRIQYMQGPDV